MPIGRKTKKRLQSVSRKNTRGKSKKIGLGRKKINLVRKKIGGVLNIIKSTRAARLNSAYNDKAKTEIINVIERDGLALESVDNAFKIDKDVVKAAVTQNGLALQFADASLKNDEAIVLAAVTQNGLAIQFANTNLREHWKETMLAAIKQDPDAKQYENESAGFGNYGYYI